MKVILYITLLIFGFVSGAFGQCEYFQSERDSLNNSSLVGTIHNEMDSGNLDSICITLEKESKIIARLSASERGKYEILKLSPGVYNVIFEYENRYIYVNDVSIKSYKVMFLDINVAVLFDEKAYKKRNKKKRRIVKKKNK